MEKKKLAPAAPASFLLFISLSTAAIVLTTSLPTTNNSSSQFHKVPAHAAKAGGRLKPEVLELAQAEPQKEIEIPLIPMEEVNYDYEDDDEEHEEDKCGERMYWHIRGARCVPDRCPHKRDPESGKCIQPRYGYYYGFGGGGGYSPGRYGSWLNRRPSSKMRGMGRMSFGRKG